EMMHCKNYDNMEIKMTPNEAFKTKGEWIDPENAINRISASLIVPYPPGIPFIIPGQKITQTMVNTILSLMENNNTAIHGIINKKMKVV
ncbi:decarboxylase, partial [candidate division WOR-3 bacterium]|nr:decarboxylase [candidate division WOR-3 bacterium]